MKEKNKKLAPRTLQLLDWGERILLLVLYSVLVIRTISTFRPDKLAQDLAAGLPLLLSEGLVIFFIIIRRKTEEISYRVSDWLIAVGATCMALLVRPEVDASLIPLEIGAGLLLFGVFFQLISKLALGRSLGCVPANRGLKLGGPYKLVRHPMYAGYLISHIAFLLVNPSVWNCVIYLGCYSLQIPRILAEERFLEKDPRYLKYQEKVHYRLLPGIF